MLLVLTFAAALFPSLFLIWYFRSRDRNPEPGRVVWTTFFLGVAIVAPILVVAWPLDHYVLEKIQNPIVGGFLQAFLAAAIPEEFFKYLVVTRYSSKNKAFDEPMDGVVYGVVASLGFAAFENVLYCMSGGMHVAIVRAATAVLGHACTGAVMGYYVGQAKFALSEETRAHALRTGLGAAILLHGFYDFPLLAMNALDDQSLVESSNPLLMLGLLAMMPAVLWYEVRWTRRLVRQLRATQDRDALASGEPVSATPSPVVELPNPGLWPPPTYMNVGSVELPSPPSPHPNAFVSVVMLLVGGLLATEAGLMLLGWIVTLADGDTSNDAGPGIMVFVLMLFVVLPGVAGIRVFRRGLQRLHG